MGCGGVGIDVQGQRTWGSPASSPSIPDRWNGHRGASATETFGDILEATEFVRGVTNGQGAHAAIVTTGVRTGEHIGQAFSAIRKAGTVVVTGLGSYLDTTIPVDMAELTLYQKRIQGCLYGNGSPRLQIPRLLSLYRNGILKLDELITRRYSLDQLNDGYADMYTPAGTSAESSTSTSSEPVRSGVACELLTCTQLSPQRRGQPSGTSRPLPHACALAVMSFLRAGRALHIN